MLRFSFFICGFWLSCAALAFANDAVGLRDAELSGPRPLHFVIWYPAEAGGDTVVVGENPAFYGSPVIRDATPGPGARPLVVLSHGYGGSWRNLGWLADALTGEGYIVAAPDHPGTTTFDADPEQAARLWERPHDLSRVIDALIADPGLGGRVDQQRIAAIGHSLGGWTVAALAGARFDAEKFETDCQRHPNPRICGLSTELGLQNPELEKDMTDPRIGAFVSFDLGMARGFTTGSLAAVEVPALVIGAGIDIGDLPAELESGYLAESLPAASTTYVEIPDAIHFSFTQLCKPGAAALIDEEVPGEGIICKDGGGRSREDIHREVLTLVDSFLGKTIPANP